MARDEHQRENLLRDAVAMVERIEWQAPDEREVVLGFRQQGGLSVYLDQDPVYHFTSDRQLRRAFIDDCLLKAVDHQLVAMRRRRVDGEVQLISQPLGEDRTQRFFADMHAAFASLLDDLKHNRLQLVGQVPADAAIEARCADWLAHLVAQPCLIAASPHAI